MNGPERPDREINWSWAAEQLRDAQDAHGEDREDHLRALAKVLRDPTRRRRPGQGGSSFMKDPRYFTKAVHKAVAELTETWRLTVIEHALVSQLVDLTDADKQHRWTGRLSDLATFTGASEKPLGKAVDHLGMEGGLIVIISPFRKGGTAELALADGVREWCVQGVEPGPHSMPMPPPGFRQSADAFRQSTEATRGKATMPISIASAASGLAFDGPGLAGSDVAHEAPGLAPVVGDTSEVAGGKVNDTPSLFKCGSTAAPPPAWAGTDDVVGSDVAPEGGGGQVAEADSNESATCLSASSAAFLPSRDHAPAGGEGESQNPAEVRGPRATRPRRSTKKGIANVEKVTQPQPAALRHLPPESWLPLESYQEALLADTAARLAAAHVAYSAEPSARTQSNLAAADTEWRCSLIVAGRALPT